MPDSADGACRQNEARDGKDRRADDDAPADDARELVCNRTFLVGDDAVIVEVALKGDAQHQQHCLGAKRNEYHVDAKLIKSREK